MARKGGAAQLRRLWSAEGLALGLGLVQGLVVARQLGPERYGVYALALTFVAFVFLLLDPRAGDATVRYLAEFRAAADLPRARAVVRLGLLLDASWGAVGVGLVLASAHIGARLLKIDGFADLFVVVALAAAVAAPINTGRAVLSVFEKFGTIAMLQVLAALVRAVSVIIVVLGGLGLRGIVWTLAAVALLEGALMVTAAVRVASGQLEGSVLTSPLAALRGRRREMARFIVIADLTTFASSAVKQADTLVLGMLSGPEQAGYYRLAKSLTTPAGNVGQPVQTIMYPRLAIAESSGDGAGADELVRRTFRRVLLPLAAAALLCVPIVGLVIVLLAGQEFAGATGAAVALVVGVAISFATLHVRPTFLVRNEMRALLGLTIVTSVASLVAYFPAAAWAGASGVAWARTLMIGLGALTMVLFLNRRRNRVTRADAMIPGDALGFQHES